MKQVPHQIWAGAAVTILVLLLAFMAALQPIQTETLGEVSRWQELSRSPGNELGDALAGVAGSLAFVWLIVTVLLQSKELRLQREELTLTRSEIEGQRKATEDMARSLAAQAQIFEAEQLQRAHDSNKALLEQRLRSLRSMMFDVADKVSWLPPKDRGSASVFIMPGTITLFASERAMREVSSLDEFIKLQSRYLQDALSTLSDRQAYSIRELPSRELPESLSRDIDLILNMEGSLSEDQLERLKTIGLWSMKSAMAKLLSLPVWIDALNKSQE